jgi:enamine deaminase RidA (YjgF/YER057c/UK114 family)
MPRHHCETIAIAGVEHMGFPLSATVIVDDSIFIFGHAADDPETGELRPGMFAEEAEPAFANLQRVLRVAGSCLNDAIAVPAYVADICANFSLYDELSRRWFVPPYVGADLAGLPFEMEALARRTTSDVVREQRTRKEGR